MDPFSIIVGTGSLIQMSLQLAKYLKGVCEAAALFEGEVGFLLHEIQDIELINGSIEQLYKTEIGSHSYGRPELTQQELQVWQTAITVLQACTGTVERLQLVLEAVVGKDGPKVTGWRDGIKKQLKKQSKDGELGQIRRKLSDHRESLDLSLTLLNLLYTRRSSREAEVFGFQLLKQISLLESRLSQTETETFKESLQSATTIASTLRLNKHFDTPKTVSSIYTGRKSYLDGLKQAFDSSHTLSEPRPNPRRFVVYGLGGSGKTQFCCKFASDNKQRFWGVFTVDASSPGNAQQSFIAIAKACGTDPNERAARSWLSSSDRPWLLLIDNADDTGLEIDNYFPDGEHGLTLITTRNADVKRYGNIGPQSYHFERLDDDEASELLLRAADNRELRTSTLMRTALVITRTLGALPLALVHAGNAIRAKYCALNNYISYYERSWQLIRQSRRVADQMEDDGEYMKVYASYEIVFRGLEAIKVQKYRDAVQLLKLFSFLHHEHIPFDLLIAAVKHPRIQRASDAQEAEHREENGTGLLHWVPQLRKSLFASFKRRQLENQYPIVLPTFLRDSELSSPSDDYSVRLREALHLLTQLSLVTYYEDSDSYSMHPLVHTWVRERPQMTIQDQAVWCEAALNTLSRCVLFPLLDDLVDPHRILAWKLLPHIVSVDNLRHKVEGEFVSNRHKRRRPWPALEYRLSPWRAMFLAKSGFVHSECGNFAEAEARLRIVTDFNRKVLGPNHPRTERAALAVSGCLWQQCRVNEAADLQAVIYHGNLEVLGPDHPRTLTLMTKLGESRRHQGRFSESMELLTKAMEGMQTQLPDTDPAIYHVLEQLGTTLRVCYCFGDAKKYHEQAVAGMKRCLGEKDMKTLVATEELAITYKELSAELMDTDGANAWIYLQTAYKHATFVVEERKRQLGDKNPLTWKAQGVLGRVKAAMGEVDEAESLFSSILPIAARHLGDDHLTVLSHKNHYANILIQQKRYREAEMILKDISRPAKYKTATSTGDHPDRWNALWTLVLCYQKQGNVDGSLTTCSELMEAVKVTRHERRQDEISSTFWEMISAKKTELQTGKRPNYRCGLQRSVICFTARHFKPHWNAA